MIDIDGAIDFDAMQTRLHPAESRINRLSGEIPARFIGFDVLVWNGAAVWQRAVRRRGASRSSAMRRRFDLSPSVADPEAAMAWLEELELLGLDGVVAKRLDQPVDPGGRGAVVKVKPDRTADCVVVGVRWKSKPDRDRNAPARALRRRRRRSTTSARRPSRPRATTRSPSRCCRCSTRRSDRRFSEPNRWGGSGLEEQPLRPELVAEVRYDKVQGNRFRHGTKLLRFRPDKDPASCTWAELRPPREPGGLTVAGLLAR